MPLLMPLPLLWLWPLLLATLPYCRHHCSCHLLLTCYHHCHWLIAISFLQYAGVVAVPCWCCCHCCWCRPPCFAAVLSMPLYLPLAVVISFAAGWLLIHFSLWCGTAVMSVFPMLLPLLCCQHLCWLLHHTAVNATAVVIAIAIIASWLLAFWKYFAVAVKAPLQLLFLCMLSHWLIVHFSEFHCFSAVHSLCTLSVHLLALLPLLLLSPSLSVFKCCWFLWQSLSLLKSWWQQCCLCTIMLLQPLPWCTAWCCCHYQHQCLWHCWCNSQQGRDENQKYRSIYNVISFT